MSPRKQRYVLRDCRYCGRSFPGNPHANYCCASHEQRAWKAWAMLRGTHGYVKGKWQRLTGVA